MKRTLHVGLRVPGLGYQVMGTVPETGFGSLTMLRLPGDEFVTLELVQWPAGHPDGMTEADFAT